MEPGPLTWWVQTGSMGLGSILCALQASDAYMERAMKKRRLTIGLNIVSAAALAFFTVQRLAG